MNEDKNSKENFFEDVIKKTKLGLTFPKELRENLLESQNNIELIIFGILLIEV